MAATAHHLRPMAKWLVPSVKKAQEIPAWGIPAAEFLRQSGSVKKRTAKTIWAANFPALKPSFQHNRSRADIGLGADQ